MKPSSLLLAAVALAASTGALAHTVWLRQDATRPEVFQLYYGGHAGAIQPYQADRLKTVSALDAAGAELPVTRSGAADRVRLQVSGAPAVIALHFDNGIHTRTGTGPSVKRPMNEVEGAISATNAQKYHKTIVRWGADLVVRPLGQPFEVVPLSAQAPRAGEPMRVRVLIDGEPAADVRIGRGEDNGEGVTDAGGVAVFTPEAGFNRIWAGRRIPVSDDPRFTELSYEYAFGFTAP